MTRRVMYDIETLSTHTSEAVIISAAAVEFILEPTGYFFGDIFYKNLDVTQQIALGRRVDRGTQEWWMGQGGEAREMWAAPGAVLNQVECKHFAAEFNSWWRDHDDTEGPGRSRTELWANGIAFDISNTEHLLRTFDKLPPWDFRAVRDLRTVRAVLHRDKDVPGIIAPTGAPHDPIFDCKRQIHSLWEHLPVDQF